MNAHASRREMLQAAGALLVFASLPADASAQARATGKSIDPAELDTWIAVSPNGAVTAYFGKADVGQGVEVAIAQIVADELDVAVERVTVVMADTALTCDQGGVSGSQGISRGGVALRNAAAEARRILLARAAEQLKMSAETLTVENGVVTGGARKLTYGQLVKAGFKSKLKWNGQYRNALDVTGEAKVKAPSAYKVVGKSPPRRDVAEKIYGKFQYVADVRVKGMVHARVMRPAIAGAKIVSVDEASIGQIAGASVVRRGDFVAVIAPREWDAVRAMRALKVTWSDAKPPFVPSEQVHDHIRNAPVVKRATVKNIGDVDAAFKGATLVEAEYEWPYQSHASLGPGCGVADVRADGVTMWSHSQKVHALAQGVSKLLNRKLESVRAIYVQGPGSFGRNDSGDAAADAALISSIIGKPVRVQYMRADATAWDPKAPATVHRVRAVIKDGKVAAHEFTTKAFTRQDVGSFESEVADLLCGMLTGAVRDPEPVFEAPVDPYVFANQRTGWEVIPAMLPGPSPLRTSNMRDPLGTQLHFASESFMDECALAAGADPIAFRLVQLTNPRYRAAIEAVAKAANWKPGPPGARRALVNGKMVGRGFACGQRGETIIAEICEVEVDRETGRVWPRKFWVAHDCGLIVNPGTLKQVIEANIVFACSRALFEEVKFDARNVTSTDWVRYPILEIADAPESVEVILINRPDLPPSGAGEPASRPVAPGLANAIFDATGVRLRSAPFTPQRVKAAIAAHGDPSRT